MKYTNEITISKGNKKTGFIPSVSLPPKTTCNPDAPCTKCHLCYIDKICRMRPNVLASYQHNLDVYKRAPDVFFAQVEATAKLTNYFRYFVSGDIPNVQFFDYMVKTAINCPNCKFLVFTKQFEIVNNYLTDFAINQKQIPANLQIILSGWGAWQPENPFNLPMAQVIFKGQAPLDNWLLCGGNCAECACRGVGCWQLKKGEIIAFNQH